MGIFEINSVPYGSTAKIMLGIVSVANQNGMNVKTSTGYSTHPIKCLPESYFQIGTAVGKLFHIIASVITGNEGHFSRIATKQLLSRMNKDNAYVIHLHNLHSGYLNLPLLFKYIKKNNIKVIWTLHDCWAFTGHCPHFTIVKCDKWKTGCYKCPSYKEYPKSLFDNSKKMFRWKKEWFTGVKNMTIVTPSEWLAGLVKQSFLKDYPVKVINNGINLDVFQPRQSDFREKYGIKKGQFVLLGVAFDWGVRKGLDVFIELSKRLDGDKYKIVLVGTNDKIDKELPGEIISIHRTQNQVELAKIYTAADVFVNPTREDNYPTVNMESIACGTPVITFKTGGSPECIDETTGVVVDCGDIDAMQSEIERVCEEKPFTKEDCLARAKTFDENIRYEDYLDLYRKISEEP